LPSERIKMLFGSAPAPRSDHPFLYWRLYSMHYHIVPV
jgi:hypothetical protein